MYNLGVRNIPPSDQEYESKLAKPNRRRRLEPKVHQIAQEHGRSLKNIWQRILAQAQKAKEKL